MKNIGNIIKSLQNIMRRDPGVSGDAQRIEQLGWLIFLKILDDKDQELELLNNDYREEHKFITESAFHEYRKNRIPEPGDLLIARVGAGIGEAAVIDQNVDFAFYVSLGLVKTFKDLTLPKYLAIVCNSPYGVRYSKGNISSGGTSAGNYNVGRIRSFAVPLPPLAEQRAIVERVDRLLALVDELAAQVSERKTQANALMQAVLREAFAE